MKKRFYLGLIFFAVLLLALAGLIARSGAAVLRTITVLRTRADVARDGAASASLPSGAR